MELESIRVFVKVVQLGSFSKAADLLRLPKSTVSRTISRLEGETGTRLLVRTTRSLTPTAAGRAFYEGALGPIQRLEDAYRSLQGQDSILAGTLRITAPEDLGGHVISPIVGKLSREHPELQFEVEYTDEVIDLVRDGYDLAIRIGKLSPSRFKVRKLGRVILIPVASPHYLKSRPRIRTPEDLKLHDCLTYSPESSQPKWDLHSRQGSVQVAIRPKVIMNTMSSLMSLAIQGAGIASVPTYLCQSALASGQLCRVLPDWSEAGLPVSLVSPLGANASSRLKLISQQLATAIEKALR